MPCLPLRGLGSMQQALGAAFQLWKHHYSTAPRRIGAAPPVTLGAVPNALLISLAQSPPAAHLRRAANRPSGERATRRRGPKTRCTETRHLHHLLVFSPGPHPTRLPAQQDGSGQDQEPAAGKYKLPSGKPGPVSRRVAALTPSDSDGTGELSQPRPPVASCINFTHTLALPPSRPVLPCPRTSPPPQPTFLRGRQRRLVDVRVDRGCCAGRPCLLQDPTTTTITTTDNLDFSNYNKAGMLAPHHHARKRLVS